MPDRIYFAVPGPYTIGDEFDNYIDAVRHARSTIVPLSWGGWTRAFVDERRVTEHADGKTDEIGERTEIFRTETYYVAVGWAAPTNPWPIPHEIVFRCVAETALDALDSYSRAEGFAPYSATEMLEEVTFWDDPLPRDTQGGVKPRASRIASAPFTNTEIVAYPASVNMPADPPPDRTVFVGLKVIVPGGDNRTPEAIQNAIMGAIETWSDLPTLATLRISPLGTDPISADATEV